MAFVPYEDFRELQKSLNIYAKSTDHQSLAKEVKSLKEIIELSANYEFVRSKLEQLEFKMNNKLFDYTKKDDFTSGISSILQSIEGANIHFETNKFEINSINQLIKTVNDNLNKKLEYHHLTGATTKIWNKVKTLASSQELKEIKDYVMPNIDFVRLRVADFTEEIHRNKEIINFFFKLKKIDLNNYFWRKKNSVSGFIQK